MQVNYDGHALIKEILEESVTISEVGRKTITADAKKLELEAKSAVRALLVKFLDRKHALQVLSYPRFNQQ